ncbi:MAG: Gfo/Idh/MocA family oxidoreductase, partial [Alphaproteobacteria bacterium]|nr:Gfo/Idh/MocA family oxidoreductase [Alphaproteobacteria bacterium]
MTTIPFRVASLGIGWWSDVLADAAQRTNGRVEIATCFTRSADKRQAFAAKYGCDSADSLDDILADDAIDGIINTTPNHVHLETTSAAAQAGKHVFLDKPIANTIGEAKAITKVCADSGVVLGVGYQRRREGHFRWIKERIDAGEFGTLVQAEANISRDRAGQFEPGHWRYTAEGMPGGVMLQIGLHYVDVLMMLLGPVKSVSGMASQLVLPGDNPDVGTLLMTHESGAVSSLSTSYASASEYYLMNIYGKKMSAYYNLFDGLRCLHQGETGQQPVAVDKNDTLVEELVEWADAVQNGGVPEVGGEGATESLAVVKAGIRSVAEGRHIEVADVLA